MWFIRENFLVKWVEICSIFLIRENVLILFSRITNLIKNQLEMKNLSQKMSRETKKDQKTEKELVMEELQKVVKRDQVQLPMEMEKSSTGERYYNEGSTFSLSNDLINSPFKIRMNHQPLNSVALKILDIAIAAFNSRTHEIRQSVYGDSYILKKKSMNKAEKDAYVKQALNKAHNELEAKFNTISSRTVRLSKYELNNLVSTLSCKTKSKGSKSNTRHIENSVSGLLDTVFHISKKDEDGGKVKTFLSVFEEVTIGLSKSDKIKDLYLVFTQSFIKEILGVSDYYRFNFSHYYRLSNQYAIRMYRFLVSRSMSSIHKYDSEFVFKAMWSVENWRQYLDLTEHTEYKIGTREELIAWGRQKSKGFYCDEKGAFINSVFVDDATIAIDESKTSTAIGDDDKLLCSNAFKKILESKPYERLEEELKGKSILVYKTLPYAMPSKLKQVIFDKAIKDCINDFKEGGITITNIAPYKKGREIAGFEVCWIADKSKIDTQHISKNDEGSTLQDKSAVPEAVQESEIIEQPMPVNTEPKPEEVEPKEVVAEPTEPTVGEKVATPTEEPKPKKDSDLVADFNDNGLL
ncbi:hypothetical protein RGL59_004536 [Vibrio parahaemolyticus]|nr:hypothetical protein [Vibrio parahaemolyticus]